MSMLWSHPDQTLKNHLSGVLDVALSCVESRSFSGWNPDRLKDLTAVAAVFHDFAKATSYFQSYILSEEKKKTRLRTHSALSAVVSYYVGKHVLEGNGENPFPASFFLFMAVRRHHGNIQNLMSEINAFRDQDEILLKQAKAIDYDGWNQVMEELLPRLPRRVADLLPFDEPRIRSWILDFQHERRRLRKWVRKRYERDDFRKVTDYFQYSVLYSILLDADKNQAALREHIRLGRREIDPSIVDRFKSEQSWPSSGLNQLREQAYQEVAGNVDCAEGRLFSIQLPTGMGKTLVALNAALKLREKRKRETGTPPRILYALPFLSVIDQNHRVFEQVLSTGRNPVDHSLMIKHHSLMAPEYRHPEEEDFVYDSDAAQMLLEGWNSEIVCTTFVQLFQSLLNNRNRTLRRFHRFSHAILLIDEVQSIPVKYWSLMREMLLEISEGMNSDVILLTATEPKIFEPSDPITSLCERRRYFESLHRITIHPRLSEKQTLEEMVESIPIRKDQTHLFIMNTISSAKELYSLLTERIQEPVGFLSTHLPPKERLRRIQDIKAGDYRWVVSTQLVEAGVDIDFDVVYRDLAPLDSINQSAGRCNRNGNRSGQLHVVHLWNGTTPYGSYIYEPVKLDVTRSLLQDYDAVSEPMLLPLIDSYFEKTKQVSNRSESDRILKGVQSLYFAGEESPDRRPVNQFRLIEEDQQKMDVFIELDDEAAGVWAEFERIVEMEHSLDRYRQFSTIKKRFREYVISIPTQVDHRPPLVHGIGYVGQATLNDYYDCQTGFIPQGVTSIW
ncbi:CRISPR-associated helicase/endonuclease Cas3 [Paludifilum halophilum]|uniref:CRISPR-associated helicase/endonuclease Cas3 n=1 Tax=Paludifilum halophilum TaxID=1642702 RepID=A0A235B2P0_9BACL|nr:CRISPR-associated helicase/endonuclease Cas3 [Paludifilum halophilum]OYD06229.1 hypothetical protein CHM34_17365 [Paludifilum halophilum]